jgi:hypothetical protein
MDKSNLDVRVHRSFLTISKVVEKIDRNEINFDLKFREDFEPWSLEKRSQYINFLLLGLSVSIFHVCSDGFIIDGYQRLLTLKEYIIDNSFPLQYLEFDMDWEDKKFLELERSDRRAIYETQVPFVELEIADNPNIPDLRHVLFQRFCKF